MIEMVSQAEKEGVSLAVMIAREMTAEEMDAAQLELASELSTRYTSIKHFMADVEVPSIEEALVRIRTRDGLKARDASDGLAADIDLS